MQCCQACGVPKGGVSEGLNISIDFVDYEWSVWIGALEGPNNFDYTITWDWEPCHDLDLDGWLDDTCGGFDCDDNDPLVHPCATEEPDNAIDDDCLDGDRDAHVFINEEEDNDTSEDAQSLGTLNVGDEAFVYGAFCWWSDADYYTYNHAENGSFMLEVTWLYPGGETYEFTCFAAEPEVDMWFGIEPWDRNEDGVINLDDMGDYLLHVWVEPTFDNDADGYFDWDYCGVDCDDDNANANPCGFPDAAGDGEDWECIGWDFPDDAATDSEPNDDCDTAQNLGLLAFDDVMGVDGNLSDVGFDYMYGYTGDRDTFTFTLPGAGVLWTGMSFACDWDFDFYIGFCDTDGMQWTFSFDFGASTYVPELGGVIFTQEDIDYFDELYGNDGEFFVSVVGYEGDPDDYHLYIEYESVCDLDEDGDGYYTSSDPELEDYCDDCDDSDASVNPGAAEDCGVEGSGNGVDDNCDGTVDEGCIPEPHNIALAEDGGKANGTAGYLGLFILPLAFVVAWRMRRTG